MIATAISHRIFGEDKTLLSAISTRTILSTTALPAISSHWVLHLSGATCLAGLY
jgi:hypothetical protein